MYFLGELNIFFWSKRDGIKNKYRSIIVVLLEYVEEVVF